MQDPSDPQNDEPSDDQAAELPTIEDLAAELNEVEDQAAETAPDPAEDGTDPPADGTEADETETEPAPGETEAAPGETPASEPEAPGDAQEAPGDAQEAEVEAPDRTVAPPIRSAQAEKKTADATRRKKAIAAAPRPPDPSEADLKEQARKEEIRAKMQAVQDELDDILELVEACRDELKNLSAQLYPHAVASDHLVLAVRGYVASQKRLRATRASAPEQIKRILEAAGKAPIDAAFQRQRARGRGRPTRTMVPPKPTGGDAAPGADKPKPDADAA
jgi:small-conductance mechanosensitive channel